MKRASLLILGAAFSLCGCTTASLKHYTLAQNSTSGDVRDHAVLNCLATVAANPESLPSYSIYSNGVTSVTDSLTLGHTLTWAPGKATLEALALTGSRSPKGQWTIDPAVEYERLEALHAACSWVLFGQQSAEALYNQILGDPTVLLDNKPHFNVEKRLEKIEPGWLCVGGPRDVPPCTRYVGNCGNTWVWVVPGRTEAFAAFTLALQDIATLDPTIITAPPLLVQITTNDITNLPDTADKTKFATIATNEIRAIKPEHRAEIETAIREGLASGKVNLTRRQWFEYSNPWYGQRTSSSIAPAAASLAGRAQPTPLAPGFPAIPGRSLQPTVIESRQDVPILGPPAR
jgi:hypothetical protein